MSNQYKYKHPRNGIKTTQLPTDDDLGNCQCGDKATTQFRGKNYCRECYDELTIGKISHKPAFTGVGRGGH